METTRFDRNRKLEEGRMQVSEDRFSNLPDNVIDNIVSRQPSRSIAWMSTLSKKWFYLIESFPGLFFEDEEFKDNHYRRKPKRLCLFMKRYLEHRKPTPIQKIRIGTSRVQDSEINPKLYEFTDLFLSDKIRELYLIFRHIPEIHEIDCQCYVLPDSIFSHGAYLTVLELVGCRFGNLDAVCLPFLKTVSLNYVCNLGGNISKLVAASSCLENLILKHCHEFKILQIYNPSLQKLLVKNCRDVESFSLSCPRLQCLKFVGKDVNYGEGNQTFLSFWISCCDLKEVCFSQLNLDVEVFDHIFSISPYLQSLIVSFCMVQGSLKLVPKTFKYLALRHTYFPGLLCLSTIESFSFTGSQTIVECPEKYLIFSSPLVNFSQLKLLELRGDFPPTSEALEYILSMLPQLHTLYLFYCWNLSQSFKIISNTLKILSIKASHDMEEVYCQIEAPKLVSFVYEGPKLQIFDAVISHELVAKFNLSHELFDRYDPSIASWCQYFRTFKKARMIILSDSLHECVFTPTQSQSTFGGIGRMEISVCLMKRRYEEWISNMLSGFFYPTSISISFRPGGPPVSRAPSALVDLQFDYHTLELTVSPWARICEANIKIIKNPNPVLNLMKTLFRKKRNLKWGVEFGDKISEERRASLNSSIMDIFIKCSKQPISYGLFSL